MKSSSVTIQMKATEQYFTVVLFIMLYKVILAFAPVDEILKCGHTEMKASEQYFRVMQFIFVCKAPLETFMPVHKISSVTI